MINQGEHIIPDDKIVCVPERPEYAESMLSLIEPMSGKGKRPELGQHSYHCLPLVVGSQYGWAIRSLTSWTAMWNGGPMPSDVLVMPDPADGHSNLQFVSSHFGSGIITVQNRFHFRTAPGVNLMVMDAPNYFHFNLQNLFAVIETDNLRRDFTFNLKITRPGVEVRVTRGDLISAILPIPRYFVDEFEVVSAVDLFPPEVIAAEQEQGQKFAQYRAKDDLDKPHQVGKLYWRGVDADGKAFADHQRKVQKRDWKGREGLLERMRRLAGKEKT
jgi:hypothetical protein